MAKAKEITGLDCAANVADWARAVLIVRFGEIVELREAALDFDDIEGVHDMRVATRRLRSALRDFLPFVRKNKLKNARRELKQIADALGAVRDEDVAIAALEELQTEAENTKAGFENLVNERRARRDAARANLREAITDERLTELRQDFEQAVSKAVSQKKEQINFSDAGKQIVGAAFRDFYELGDSLYNPFAVEPLHEFRIAAKRLRYAIELYVSCWGERIEVFAEEVAKMQGFLGELHDADVWIEDLGARLGKSSGANENEFQAAARLLSNFVKTRTANYRRALELWSEWQTNDFAGKMRELVAKDNLSESEQAAV